MPVLAVIVQEAAATARHLAAPSPINVTNTMTNEGNVLQWLKITAVPLGVFLMGACTWGYIKNMALWKRLTGAGVESPDAPPEQTTNSNPSSNRNAADLEVGLELSHRRDTDEGLATTPPHDLTVQHPAVQAAHGDGKVAMSEGASQL